MWALSVTGCARPVSEIRFLAVSSGKAQIELAGDEVDDGLEMSVGPVSSGLGFCCLDEAVDALEDFICNAGVEPPQYACFMPLDGSGGLDDGREA